MKKLHLVEAAANSKNSRTRINAVRKLDREGNVAGLVRILNESIYKDSIERAELALAKYNFK